MQKCKKYINLENVSAVYRTKPIGDCQNCAYFSAKNCGVHLNALIHQAYFHG